MNVRFARRTDLALAALQVLAKAGGRVTRSDLAEETGTTPSFLPQVMAPMVQAGWVKSERGPGGGYQLTDAAEARLLEVVEATEGPTSDGRCVMRDGPCPGEVTCPIHAIWVEARRPRRRVRQRSRTALTQWRYSRMTQTITRPPTVDERPPPPPHPHYTLGTLIVLGIIGTLVAVGIGIAALMITASRNSVDDALVAERVDTFLESSEVPAGTGAVPEDVLPVFVPKEELAPVPSGEVNVAIAPQVPPPSGRTTQAIVEVEFEVVEGVSMIDPATGVETETWGYKLVDGSDGIVVGTPGPIIRARVGDILRFTITNPSANHNPHNVDFHAVTGQGGGAEATTVAPGETKTIEARLLYPGFFMYHCAYGDIPAHISHGMFGGILVDPETPLPEVEHEWYMVQSEYYTASRKPGEVHSTGPR